MPNTHRTSTLQSISSKQHDISSKVMHLAHEAKRMRDLVDQAPQDGSRIDWLYRQVLAS